MNWNSLDFTEETEDSHAGTIISIPGGLAKIPVAWNSFFGVA
jgi:hypothetical protein